MSIKVSIITPVYNSEEFLSECLDSVLAQSYSNWEMIMVDDCSSDRSIEIIEEYIKRDDRFILFQLESNQGSGIARNKAIKEAKGEIIAFLDSDDIWHPKKLEIHLAFMIEKNAAFSHTSYGYINEEGEKIRDTFHVSAKPVGYKDLLKRTEISCLTAMYNVAQLGKMYMPDLRRKQDYALWLSILKRDMKSYPLDEELAFYRQRENSATSNKFALIGKHFVFLWKYEKLNPFSSFYYTLMWIYNGLIKYYI